MFRFSKPLSTTLFILILIALGGESVFAHPGGWSSGARQAQEDEKKDKKEKRAARRARKEKETDNKSKAPTNGVAPETETLEVVSDRQSKNGDVFTYEGYVNATFGDIRLQADHVTFN